MQLVQFLLGINGVGFFLHFFSNKHNFLNLGNNVWLRERGQEFKRPCELQPDHEPDDVWISLLGQ